jgi:hypothetical protein
VFLGDVASFTAHSRQENGLAGSLLRLAALLLGVGRQRRILRVVFRGYGEVIGRAVVNLKSTLATTTVAKNVYRIALDVSFRRSAA